MALMENATGNNIKALRLENGGEYTNKAFQEFCAHEGIRREDSPIYTSAKWCYGTENRAIVGAVKAMLYDQDLPRFLWA